MENDYDEPRRADAEAALDALSRDRERLAAWIVTPWWYHPALALLVALLIGGLTRPPALALAAIVVAGLGMALLARVYARISGVSLPRACGRASRTLLLVTGAILLACLVAAIIIRLASLPAGVALAPMALAAAAVVVLGRAYDAALRRDVAQGGR